MRRLFETIIVSLLIFVTALSFYNWKTQRFLKAEFAQRRQENEQIQVKADHLQKEIEKTLQEARRFNAENKAENEKLFQRAAKIRQHSAEVRAEATKTAE